LTEDEILYPEKNESSNIPLIDIRPFKIRKSNLIIPQAFTEYPISVYPPHEEVIIDLLPAIKNEIREQDHRSKPNRSAVQDEAGKSIPLSPKIVKESMDEIVQEEPKALREKLAKKTLEKVKKRSSPTTQDQDQDNTYKKSKGYTT